MTLEDRLHDGATALSELTFQVEVDPSAPPNRNRRRNQIIAAAAALLLVVGVGFGALLVRDDPDVTDEVNTEIDDDDLPEPDLETVEDPDDVNAPELAASVPAGPRDGAASFRFPIQVEPGSNLVDGDTVQVKGRGFSPNTQVGMVQCWIDGGDGSIDNCDISNPTLFSTDGNGYFDQTIIVSRYIEVQGERVDCAAQTLTARCVLGAGELSNYDRSGAAILHFAPDNPVATPQLAVSESSALTHGQVVTVTGTEFPAGQPVELQQCVLGGFDTEEVCGQITATWLVEADGDGTFETGITLNRTVQSVDGIVDCASTTCYVFARSIPPSDPVALSFDPTGTVPEGQSVVAAGNGLLKDGQTIRIDGEAMLVDGDVRVLQCTQSGYCEDIGETVVAAGSTSATVPVQRVLWQPDVGQVDCVEERCDVVGWMSGVKVWTIELEFDSSVPAPPGPALQIKPNEGLRDGDVVTLSVSGVPASAEDYGFWYRQCTPNQSTCAEGNYLYESMVETGNTQQFTVRRLMWDYNQQSALDCAEVECRIFVDAAGKVLSTQLNFDTSVPAPDLPSLTVTPNTNLVDGQEVVVSTEGPLPGAYISMCLGEGGQSCISLPAVQTSETEMTVTVYRVVTSYQSGEPVDCAVSSCELQLWGNGGFPMAQEISFDPDSALLPPAQFSVPDGPLQHGEEFTATLQNFRGLADPTVSSGSYASGDSPALSHEGSSIFICTADGANCSAVIITDRSEDGENLTMVAWRLIPDYSRPSVNGVNWLDCGEEACELVAQSAVDRVAVPLVFDTSGPTPEPPTIVVNTDGLGQGPVDLQVSVANTPGIDDGWWTHICSEGWCVDGGGGDATLSLNLGQSTDCFDNGCELYVYHERWSYEVPSITIGGGN